MSYLIIANILLTTVFFTIMFLHLKKIEKKLEDTHSRTTFQEKARRMVRVNR